MDRIEKLLANQRRLDELQKRLAGINRLEERLEGLGNPDKWLDDSTSALKRLEELIRRLEGD